MKKNKIGAANVILLIYLAYYGCVMIYFRASIVWKRDMLSALGMALIIGFALNILQDKEFFRGCCRLSHWEKKWWTILRICIVPFCVSSFSALGPRIGGYLLIVPLKWLG